MYQKWVDEQIFQLVSFQVVTKIAIIESSLGLSFSTVYEYLSYFGVDFALYFFSTGLWDMKPLPEMQLQLPNECTVFWNFLLHPPLKNIFDILRQLKRYGISSHCIMSEVYYYVIDFWLYCITYSLFFETCDNKWKFTTCFTIYFTVFNNHSIVFDHWFNAI